jgi:O-antigen/teichoic acid export membrane protein
VLFAEPIVAIVYPAHEFAPTVDVLRLLGPRVLLLYASSVLMYTLVALHQERRLLIMVCAFAVATPLADVIAIRVFAQNGAALVSSLTELAWLWWLARLMPADLLHRRRVVQVAPRELSLAPVEEVA